MLVSIVIVTMIADVVSGAATLQDISVEPKESSEKPGEFVIRSREDWKARQPRDVQALKTPVEYVVIHHSFVPPACVTNEECTYAMRTMQCMHMDDKKWSDIGYNFAVGGNGVIYTGRGWDILGAHSIYFNNVSIGICLIGNYNETLPSKKMIEATKWLISEGARLGHLTGEYKIVGHRQARPTECPGEALFDEIKNWSHYDPADILWNYRRHQKEAGHISS